MLLFLFFLKILFIFRERGREGEREGEVHQLVASRTYAAEDPACNPGRCPDWELNLRPLGLQAGTQSTERYQPGIFRISRHRPMEVNLN